MNDHPPTIHRLMDRLNLSTGSWRQCFNRWLGSTSQIGISNYFQHCGYIEPLLRLPHDSLLFNSSMGWKQSSQLNVRYLNWNWLLTYSPTLLKMKNASSIYPILMKSVEMLLLLMNLTKSTLKSDTIDLCILVSFRRGIFLWFMTKIKIPWGQGNSNHYGMVPILSLKSWKNGPTSWLIIEEINWWDLAMVSI